MLKQRIITAVVLALLVVGVLFSGMPNVWLAFVLVVTALSAWEWCRLAKPKKSFQPYAYAVVMSLIVWLAYSYVSHDVLVSILSMTTPLAMLVMAGLVIFYQKTQGKMPFQRSGVLSILGLIILVSFSLSILLLLQSISLALLFLSLVVIWAIDIGAYFSGRRFGKNKLALYVSPGKTWEGVIGGGVFAWIISVIGLQLVQPDLNQSWLVVSVLMAGIALFSVFGDLFESVLKREAGMKDSSQLLPGHGGVLDRIDSLIIALPMFYLLWMGVLV